MQFHGADKREIEIFLIAFAHKIIWTRKTNALFHKCSIHSAPGGDITLMCDAFRSVHHNCIERPQRKQTEHADACLPLLLERVPLLLTANCGRVYVRLETCLSTSSLQILTGSLHAPAPDAHTKKTTINYSPMGSFFTSWIFWTLKLQNQHTCTSFRVCITQKLETIIRLETQNSSILPLNLTHLEPLAWKEKVISIPSSSFLHLFVIFINNWNLSND